MRNVVIACGGTGGHMTPGIALAQGLEEKGYPTWLFTSRKSVDARIAEKYPDLSFVPAPGVPFGKSPLGLARFAKGLVGSFWFSLRFYRKVGADCVVGFGGFSSAGPVFAARVRGLPVFLHEANRAVGRAVRLLAKRAIRVYLPEGVRMKGLSPNAHRSCGYPLRREFRRISRERARFRLEVDPGVRLLLVLGGSQGSAALTQWVKRNAEALAAEGISIYCLTGMDNESSGAIEMRGPSGEPVTVRFVPFSDEMNVLLSAADLVVARAGAGTIAEIVRCRTPSILVPYPHAADDHQSLNASFLEQKGGAIVCPQERLDGLFEETREVIFNDEFQAILRRNLAAADPGDCLGQLVSELTDDLRGVSAHGVAPEVLSISG